MMLAGAIAAPHARVWIGPAVAAATARVILNAMAPSAPFRRREKIAGHTLQRPLIVAPNIDII